jgi:hypothetical protein
VRQESGARALVAGGCVAYSLCFPSPPFPCSPYVTRTQYVSSAMVAVWEERGRRRPSLWPLLVLLALNLLLRVPGFECTVPAFKTHTHTRTHTNSYIYIHIRTHTHSNTHTHTHKRAHRHTHTHTHRYIHTRTKHT